MNYAPGLHSAVQKEAMQPSDSTDLCHPCRPCRHCQPKVTDLEFPAGPSVVIGAREHHVGCAHIIVQYGVAPPVQERQRSSGLAQQLNNQLPRQLWRLLQLMVVV